MQPSVEVTSNLPDHERENHLARRSMKKTPRIILNLLLPPTIAAVLLYAVISIGSGELVDWRYGAAMVIYAYVFGSAPSVTHTLTMEFFYRRGLQPRQWKAVLISAVSGTVSGLLVVVCVAIAFGVLSSLAQAFLIYPALGTATGAVTALVIRAFSTKDA